MKYLKMDWMQQGFTLLLALLLISFSNLLHAQTTNNNTSSTCVPYSIPLAGVPCDSGYTGTKFPMRTLSCPSGKITDGLTFDTSNCQRIGSQVDVNATNCQLTPTAVGCMSVPTLQGCPAGSHWTKQGTNIAHCVLDDPVCPVGQQVTHDNNGNPSCIPIVCPSNQVLTGSTCGCASGSSWNGTVCVAIPVCPSNYSVTATCPNGGIGNQVQNITFTPPTCVKSVTVDNSGCSAPPVVCPSSTTSATSCGAGYTGTAFVTTSYSGASCTPSTSTDRSGCTAVATCTPSTSTLAGPCPSGYTGLAYQTTTVSCPSGTSSVSAWDLSSCQPVPVACTPQTSMQSGPCPPLQTGTANRSVTQNCDGTVSYGNWDTSLCVKPTVTTTACPNGASNYPICCDTNSTDFPACCDNTGWSSASLAANTTTAQRQCYKALSCAPTSKTVYNGCNNDCFNNIVQQCGSTSVLIDSAPGAPMCSNGVPYRCVLY